jgi:hypothetical protein
VSPCGRASGSTIGLANPASPGSQPATFFKYDPSGKPVVDGQAANYPFLFQGIKHERRESSRGNLARE